MSYSVGQLHKYAVDLYKTLEEETGKNVGFSVVSNIRLASTKDRMDEYHQYAVNFYKTLEEETGKNVGFSVVSNIRLASTKDRMDEYHQYAGVAKTIGVDVKFLTPQQLSLIHI